MNYCKECGERLEVDDATTRASTLLCVTHLGVGTPRDIVENLRMIAEKYGTKVLFLDQFKKPTMATSTLETIKTIPDGPTHPTAGRVIPSVKRTETAWRPALRSRS